MLSFQEALAEDRFLEPYQGDEDDFDILDGWDIDVFPESDLRPELRFFVGRPPDVTFRCHGGRCVAAHRGVLTEVSYFESLFDGPFKEHKAQTLDVDEDANLLFEVFRWVYCRSVSADKDTVMEVLRLADLYGIEDLVDHCTRILVSVGSLPGVQVDAPSADDGHGGGDLPSEPPSDVGDSRQAATVEAQVVESGVALGSREPPSSPRGPVKLKDV
mmetsp:Transcript_73982/g.205636  ORF Transcript_73982/g.205636 Transcript_73982/m.205636 type:complete len:216 (-) Transcript_73982:102-749(-)